MEQLDGFIVIYYKCNVVVMTPQANDVGTLHIDLKTTRPKNTVREIKPNISFWVQICFILTYVLDYKNNNIFKLKVYTWRSSSLSDLTL